MVIRGTRKLECYEPVAYSGWLDSEEIQLLNAGSVNAWAGPAVGLGHTHVGLEYDCKCRIFKCYYKVCFNMILSLIIGLTYRLILMQC